MVETLREVLQGVAQRLHQQATTYLPSALAAIIILAGAWALAAFVRWTLFRIVKGLTIDRFLRRSGVAFVIDPAGRVRASQLVAQTAYWTIIACGVLSALSVFDTKLTTEMAQNFVFLLPKLVLSALILIGGAWLSRYLGRSLLVWAVNESLPYPRRLTGLVRVMIMFVAVVVAADQLNFARNVFLAAFIILAGGAALSVSLAVGLGSRGGVERYLEERREQHSSEKPEASVWSHL